MNPVFFLATITTVYTTTLIISNKKYLKPEREFAAGIDPRTIFDKPIDHTQYLDGEEKDFSYENDLGEPNVEIIMPAGYPKHYNYVAIINTPKCGTGGLFDYFFRSFQCQETNLPKTQVDHSAPETGLNGCPHGYALQRGHLIDHATKALETNLNIIQKDKCLVVSAIRDPATFLPSLFMEKHDNLCALAEERKHKPRHTLKLYREWLKLDAKFFYFPGISYLLNEFGAESLTSEMEKMNRNGGFSVLPHPSKLQHQNSIKSDVEKHEISHEKASSNHQSPYSNCDFLFLKLEDHGNWRFIFDRIMIVPENERPIYYKKPSGSNREKLCPALKEHYHAIQNYKLSNKEKSHIISNIPYMAEWFQIYGH